MIATLLGAFEAIVTATGFEVVGTVTDCPLEMCIVVKDVGIVAEGAYGR